MAFCLVSLHCPLSDREVESWVTKPRHILRQVALDLGNALGQIGPGLDYYRSSQEWQSLLAASSTMTHSHCSKNNQS